MAQQSRFAHWMPTGVVALVMVGVPLTFLWSSRTLSSGAEILPVAVSLIMLLCAGLSLLSRLRARAPWEGSRNIAGASLPRIAVIAAALFLFTPLAEWAGFYAVSFVTVVVGYLAFARSWKPHTVLPALLTATVFTGCAWALFYKVLLILTPRGFLF